MTKTHAIPPAAQKQPIARTHHGHTFTDPYEWLRDKDNPDVIAHLEAENAYTDTITAPQKELQDQLFAEFKAHTALDETSVPTRLRNYWYYSAINDGENYRRHYRTLADPNNPYQEPPRINPKEPAKPQTDTGTQDAQLLLDENALATGHEFQNVENIEISPDDRYLTYGVDHSGDERFTQYVIDLSSGQTMDQIEDVVYGVAWSATSNCLYYTRADDAWRPYQIWVRRIGTPADTDHLIHQEDDPTFWTGIEASRDGNWIVITAGASNTSECYLVSSHAKAGTPEAKPTSVAGRQHGLEYYVEPAGDHLLVTHNQNHADFELATAPLPAPGVGGSPAGFQSILTPQNGQRFNGVTAYATHATLHLRHQGNAAALYLLPEPDAPQSQPRWLPEGHIQLGQTPQTVHVKDSDWWWEPRIRFTAQSLITPPTEANLDPTSGEVTVLKTQETPGYNPADYREEKLWVTAQDGTQIPMTVAYHKDTPHDGSAPGIIWGYGAYEVSIDPTWNPLLQSYLNRGIIYAQASPRGGGDLGRNWYEQGRMLKKKNTFTDFIACSRALIERGYVSEGKLAAIGGSAGGLLMGAITNMAPELYTAIVALVPFVDALTTILKPELPLTAGEWEEWGNPIEDAEVYRYMAQYSPYENVTDGVAYPSVLAVTGLNDTRVFYVEPAKWVQRLREATTSDPAEKPILLRCEMVAGHGGLTGRESQWRERAFIYAYLIHQLTFQGRKTE